ncbi:SEED MATURATION PROTEIN 1 [Rosa rugosa]|nr:SEED MATURATION PROTEIN 1 [Rosa rugosa]
MAKSKDDIKYATSQARLSEDEAVRVAYEHGTPLEGGKIAQSERVDLFPAAHNISKSTESHSHDDPNRQPQDSSNQSQMRREPADNIQVGHESNTNSARFPKKTAPSLNTK